jgi:DNA (cytosine-5)-methyltransferase 1
VGSEWQQLKQIGNAVPPLLGLAWATVAGAVLQELSGRKKHMAGAMQRSLALAG